MRSWSVNFMTPGPGRSLPLRSAAPDPCQSPRGKKYQDHPGWVLHSGSPRKTLASRPQYSLSLPPRYTAGHFPVSLAVRSGHVIASMQQNMGRSDRPGFSTTSLWDPQCCPPASGKRSWKACVGDHRSICLSDLNRRRNKLLPSWGLYTFWSLL